MASFFAQAHADHWEHLLGKPATGQVRFGVFPIGGPTVGATPADHPNRRSWAGTFFKYNDVRVTCLRCHAAGLDTASARRPRDEIMNRSELPTPGGGTVTKTRGLRLTEACAVGEWRRTYGGGMFISAWTLPLRYLFLKTGAVGRQLVSEKWIGLPHPDRESDLWVCELYFAYRSKLYPHTGERGTFRAMVKHL